MYNKSTDIKIDKYTYSLEVCIALQEKERCVNSLESSYFHQRFTLHISFCFAAASLDQHEDEWLGFQEITHVSNNFTMTNKYNIQLISYARVKNYVNKTSMYLSQRKNRRFYLSYFFLV